jgi:DivIVA domain-containing protein
VISLSINTKGSGTFRRRWRGYDPEQVDEFLRRTAEDRQRLEEGLAQLDAFIGGQADERRREFERLTRLRIEVAGCLEASIGALRTATNLLANGDGTAAERLRQVPVAPPDARKRPAFDIAAFQLSWPQWISRPQAYALAASLLFAASIPVVRAYRSTSEPSAPAAAVRTPVTAPRPAPAEPPLAVPDSPEGLVLTLSAKRPCWVRTHIDGGQPLERLLKADETIVLRAINEAVLRVGDASAIALLINNQAAKPLGAPGQVVTTRISRSNYPGLLMDPSAR